MNIPNAISFFRLFLVPIFAILYFSPLEHGKLYALGIFLLAGFSDVLDGYIARKYNMTTKLGRIIDPVADKFMVFCAILCLAIGGSIHFIFPALYFVKESYQLLCAYKLMNKISDVPPATFWGKASTCLFYIAITLGVGFANLQLYAIIALIAALTTSVIAAITYYFRSKRLIQSNDRNGGV